MPGVYAPVPTTRTPSVSESWRQTGISSIRVSSAIAVPLWKKTVHMLIGQAYNDVFCIQTVFALYAIYFQTQGEPTSYLISLVVEDVVKNTCKSYLFNGMLNGFQTGTDNCCISSLASSGWFKFMFLVSNGTLYDYFSCSTRLLSSLLRQHFV